MNSTVMTGFSKDVKMNGLGLPSPFLYITLDPLAEQSYINSKPTHLKWHNCKIIAF